MTPLVFVWAFIGVIIANILVWVFLWGKRTGGINQRLSILEERSGDPPIRPECSVIFTEIKEDLANLNGKMDTVLLVMKENQKNNEKKHMTSKEQGQ